MKQTLYTAKLPANRLYAEFPRGTHWTPGESRWLSLPKGTKTPDWLVKAKEEAKKPKEE